MGKPKRKIARDDSTISSSGFRTSINGMNDDFDDVDIGHFNYRTGNLYYLILINDFILYDSLVYIPLIRWFKIFYITVPQKNGEKVRRQSTVSQVFKNKGASFGLITFFALKVIFVDIFIAIGDVATDFWQVLVKLNFLEKFP